MRRQDGVALLTAVMVVAFAATLATGMLVRQNLIIHRTANSDQFAQAWWYLVGLEQWAGHLLRRDRQETDIDSLDEPWAQPVDYIPVDEGALGGQLVDLQGRFNLNSLGAKGEAGVAAREQLGRLIGHIENLRGTPGPELAAAIADWIDPDTEPAYPGGAEDNAYLGREPPYRAANGLFASVSELLLIEGVSAEVYRALIPWVCVLPVTDSKLNVNTAGAPILASLHPELSLPEVETLIAKRDEEPWEKLEDFKSEPIFAGRDIDFDRLAVSTEYFEARGVATIGNLRTELSALLHRNSGGAVRVLAHARGPL